MGELFRRYWIPALLSEELAGPDCAPVRVRLLGEDLVAFRDTAAKVGIIDAHCPHRRAPLFFGRNEEGGIRCVYHGWKFDACGTCTDMPNEPADSPFRQKVKITAYPTFEAAGMVWTYMGPEAEQPPRPDFEWLRAPANCVFVSKTYESCNWLQALEGGLDTSHSSFTHNNDIQDKNSLRSKATAPKLEVEKTPYGYQYVGIRDLKDRGNFVRAYQYIMPAQQMRGAMLNWKSGAMEAVPSIAGHIWTPIDDTHVWVYNFIYASDPAIALTPEFIKEHEHKFGRGADDVLPAYRLTRNAANDYLIDREVQRTRTFTGIEGINTQDYALQEGMEHPFCDRTQERLGTADLAIIAARKLLLEAVREVAEGKQPRGVDPQPYHGVRAAEKIIDKNVDWRIAMAEDIRAKF
jgi:phthalate 4,5-dioxygenase oxygenase subunit